MGTARLYNIFANDLDHPERPASCKEDGSIQQVFLQMIWIIRLMKRDRIFSFCEWLGPTRYIWDDVDDDDEKELEEEEDDANHVTSYPDTDVGDEGDTGEVGEGEIRGSFKDNDKIKILNR